MPKIKGLEKYNSALQIFKQEVPDLISEYGNLPHNSVLDTENNWNQVNKSVRKFDQAHQVMQSNLEEKQSWLEDRSEKYQESNEYSEWKSHLENVEDKLAMWENLEFVDEEITDDNIQEYVEYLESLQSAVDDLEELEEY